MKRFQRHRAFFLAGARLRNIGGLLLGVWLGTAFDVCIPPLGLKLLLRTKGNLDEVPTPKLCLFVFFNQRDIAFCLALLAHNDDLVGLDMWDQASVFVAIEAQYGNSVGLKVVVADAQGV